ncbi:uncharacterized protein [Macrobrachium rosenbergii]|uniref:uncharacterized protein n=1 Tax=Macrobrachium rosenbergii TaxID=79674 RepID=UPI0034D5AA17
MLLNVSDLAETMGPDYCAAVMGLYVFTGEDCTSAFKGKGKVAALKKLEKSPRFQNTFRQLGDEWQTNQGLLQSLEQFTCIMYGMSRETSVNTACAKLLRKMVGEDERLTSKSKVDLARLPPCQAALIPHIQRANHRAAIYKRADDPILEAPQPHADGQGWMKTENGILEPIWSQEPVLPPSLVDLLDTVSHEEDENEPENEFDYDDVFDSDDDSDE